MKYAALLLAVLLGFGAFVYQTGTFVDAKWIYDTSTTLFKQGHRELSVHMVSRAAAYDYTPAMYEMGNRHFSEWRGAGNRDDSLAARQWFAQMQSIAESRRDAEDLWILGIFHAGHPWAERNLEKAVDYLQTCAAQEYVWCRLHLSMVQWDRHHREAAFDVLEPLAEAGHTEAQLRLSWMHHAAAIETADDRGRAAHWTTGIAWLRRAEAAGASRAAKELRALKHRGVLEVPPPYEAPPTRGVHSDASGV